MIEQAGVWAYTVVAALVLFAVVGLLDLLINDVLPESWQFQFARDHRHVGYIGLALGCCVFMFVMAKSGTVTILMLSYFVDAAAATFVAVSTVVNEIPSRNYPAIERRKGSA